MNIERFLNNSHGRQYAKVANDPQTKFEDILVFLNAPERRNRLVVAQEHFKMCPLAGVVIELENSELASYFKTQPKAKTKRLRQAIGVAIKLLMEEMGWTTTGKKGRLSGLSHFFAVSELYAKK